MAEEKPDAREITWRHLFPWTDLFRGFQIALDINKLLLAAAGILLMATGWWLLSLVFGAGYRANPPQWDADKRSTPGISAAEQWKQFKAERDNWNLMNEAANVGGGPHRVEIEDLAQSYEDFEKLKKAQTEVAQDLKDRANAEKERAEKKDNEKARRERKEFETALQDVGIPPDRARVYAARYHTLKPAGTLSTWPFFEERGPNPYLMVTGQVHGLYEPGHFWEWFTTSQLPVMFEPLVKMVRPIVYFFSPRADTWSRFYFLLVILTTVVVWSIFGGAITRIAAVQVARGEKIGLGEAVRFTSRRLLSYVSAPLFPLIFVLFLLIFTMIYGLLFAIPILGDILFGGVLWVVPLVIGLVMAVTLVGLAVGWPLMAPTISTEGTDSWEAVSRSYSYVFQRPWHYVWYSLVGMTYGAIVVFFIGFMGSFTVYMAKWAVNQNPIIGWFGRDPAFLSVYSPTSYGWRTLLLQGVTVDGERIVRDGEIDPATYYKYLGYELGKDDKLEYKPSKDSLSWYNKVGAFLVALWLGLLFLMLVGFGYSFFWSISTIVYLLMRRNVDAAELDEVYLEEDETEGVPGAITAAPPPPPSTAVKPGTQPLAMVEPPSRTPIPLPTPVPLFPSSPLPASLSPPVPEKAVTPVTEKVKAPAPDLPAPTSTISKPDTLAGGNGPEE